MLCDLLGAEIGASPHRFYSLLRAHLHVGKQGEGGGGGADTVASGSYRGLRDAPSIPGHQRASLQSTQRKKNSSGEEEEEEARGVFASASTPRDIITTSHLSTQRKKKQQWGGGGGGGVERHYV